MTPAPDAHALPSEWWISSTWCGVVRAAVVDGDYAIVLDDMNADHREIELRLYWKVDDTWEQIGFQDDAGFPGIGQMGSAGSREGIAFTFGRESPGTIIRLELAGEALKVVADRDGWWACIRETSNGGWLPRVL